MKGLFRIILILFALASTGGALKTVYAQFVPPAEYHEFETAMRLYEEGLYRQSIKYFQNFLDTDPGRVFQETALYHMTLSEIALDSLNYEIYAERFLLRYPAGNHTTEMLEDMAGRNYRSGLFEKALARYNQAYETETVDEKRAQYLFWMAESAYQMENPDSASALYLKLSDMYPNLEWAPKALYALGRLYLEMEAFDESSEVFETLRSRYPNHEVTRQIGTVLGEMYYRQERYEDAIQVLRNELSYLEEDARLKAVLLIAESYNYLEQFEEAAGEYRRYISLSEDEMQARAAHYGLGWVYHKQQVYHWAADAFEKAAQGNDELSRKGLYYQAINYKLSGRYDLALNVFKTFGDRYSEGFWVETAYYEWALTAFELGRFSVAIEVLQRLVRGEHILENPGRTYSLLGEAYFANNEFSRAVQAFDMAGEITDVDPDMIRQIRFQRAWVMYENHAYREAVRDFETVYRNQPSGELAAEALFWSADSYYNLGEWRNSIQRFERFVEGYPEHRLTGAAIYSLGWAYFNMRVYEEAVRYFEIFDREHEPPPIALYPYDVDTRLRLGDSFYAMGRFDDAILRYEEVTDNDSGADYAIFQIGNSYFRNERSFEAVQNFRRLIRNFPDSRLRVQAQYNIGYIYFQTGNYDQAIEEFHMLINRFPGSSWAARAQYQIGDAYYNAGNYEKAIEAYRTILDVYPRSDYLVDAVNGIQYAQVAGDMEDTSLDILESFLNQHPQTGTADRLRFKQAENLAEAGDYEEAITSFRHYIRVTTDESMLPEAYYNIAEAYEQLQQFPEAVEAFQEIVNRFPESDRMDPALLNIGRIEYERGRYSEAIASLETLVVREGRLQLEALTSLGDAYLANSQLDLAESVYDDALMRRQNYAPSLIGKGKIALERGLYLDAERYFRQVAESNTFERGAEAQYYLGKVEQTRNNFEAAIDAYSKVNVLFDAYDYWVGKAMMGTAESYQSMGQSGRANQTWRDIIERFPDSEIAR
ncbi:MAG: tetratricopeptide repeat protein, partial [Balneolales bacterium]